MAAGHATDLVRSSVEVPARRRPSARAGSEPTRCIARGRTRPRRDAAAGSVPLTPTPT